MSTLHTVAAAGPLAAGWAVHGLWFRRRIEAARRDPLTGLLGRDAFERRARKLLAGGSCAVLIVDLDGFKTLNDSAWHAAGDAALRAVGSRLICWKRVAGGVVARLGGDEFAAAIYVRSLAELRWELGRLHTALCEPVRFEGRPVFVGASIGAYWHPRRTPVDLSTAMRRADEVMYAVKQTGGGWSIACNPTPAYRTVNGRRDGRPGTDDAPEGSAR
ncbi:diguanylate cyclase with PAS/PAC sensor [Streptomyces bingchenggensis BCW-1]|uniref:Diguanylate cyclase with PAS/PAC sensor n=1 Tax=Streptomyces bingchenggensis (strain BCW-1) TaxID=749414 RepID=D7BW12_STRBB|nr:GGDEF domain-containing protein [Streptomyces milbemycinicus]ADI09741.1 diguanylate cyclase with PAS/PAC sensor [Streptomyces bingchenggensis BCW-1]